MAIYTGLYAHGYIQRAIYTGLYILVLYTDGYIHRAIYTGIYIYIFKGLYTQGYIHRVTTETELQTHNYGSSTTLIFFLQETFYKKPVLTFLTYDIEMMSFLHPKHRNDIAFTSQCKKLEYPPQVKFLITK